MRGIILLGIASSLFAAGPAGATTRRVPQDYPMIQWALNSSSPGDTVLVDPGTYTQDLSLPSGVTLRSAAGAAVTRLLGSGSNGGLVVTGGGAGTRFEGFTVEGFLDGIVAIGGSPSIERNVVIGNLIAGIDLADSADALVRDNLVSGSAVGILCDAGAAPLVERNTLVRNDTAFDAITGSSPVFRNNIVALNSGVGVHSQDASPAISCNDVWNNGQAYGGDLGDLTGTGGNIADDPWFCAPALDRFGLREGSPCRAGAPGGCGRRGAYDVECQGRLILVDPAGSGDFTSVAPALAAGNAPDSVEIASGIYQESLTLTEALVLRGGGDDPADVVIDAGAAAHALHVAGVDSSGAVRRLTLRGGTTAALRITGGSRVRAEEVLLTGGAAGAVAQGSQPRFEAVTAAGCAGDGLRLEAASAATITRCLLAENGAFGIHALGGSGASVSCTALFGNDGGAVSGLPDPTGANGNIAANPLFCNPAEDRYTLRAGSPCLPDTAACGGRGALGLGCARKVWTVFADGSGEAPTIAAAIDSCLAADTVRVGPGVYAESLALDPGLVLEGRDGAEATRVSLAGAADGLVCAGCGANTEIRGLTFAGYSGAGVRLADCAGARVRGVRLESCGAGARVVGGHALFDSCAWWQNGLGVQAQGDSVRVTRSTIHAQSATGVYVDGGCAARVDHTIVSASGTAGIRVLAGGAAALACNDVWSTTGFGYVGTVPGPGDISADPRFCDEKAGDFTLMTTSPCIPDSTGACGLIGLAPMACGLGTGVPSPPAGEPGAPALSLALAGHPSTQGSRLEIRGARADAFVGLELYDARGRRLWRATERVSSGGSAGMQWPPGELGAIAPGVYFLRAESAGARAQIRWILVR